MQSTRSWKNLLIAPLQQIRIAMLLIGTTLAYFLIMLIVVVYMFSQIFYHIPHLWDNLSNEYVAFAFINLGILFFILIIHLFTLMIIIILRTHKIYGPMVSVNRFVKNLANGMYQGKLSIRKNDDFSSLVLQLNTLAEALITNHPQLFSHPEPSESETLS